MADLKKRVTNYIAQNGDVFARVSTNNRLVNGVGYFCFVKCLYYYQCLNSNFAFCRHGWTWSVGPWICTNIEQQVGNHPPSVDGIYIVLTAQYLGCNLTIIWSVGVWCLDDNLKHVSFQRTSGILSYWCRYIYFVDLLHFKFYFNF